MEHNGRVAVHEVKFFDIREREYRGLRERGYREPLVSI